MTEIKDYKKAVNAFIKKTDRQCSVCNQHIRTNEQSFANMRGLKTLWGRYELRLFIPKETTFTIPYLHITSYFVHKNGIEINLVHDDRVVSIRGIK